ncbi:urea ABC transporter ATP-binding subunit UrtE [Acidihalobacter ferrooxydans]|uniref:urea ABC transporter ATP-binding subunit UrtE n=1 Tax=Acidihalobacter ferrooxydans TaxID=1765967 RepID=UPI0018DE70BD|nr:urea ABC transporter ATP-binding subunit UrtE [Acidihalobacter ferrooxydans]
MTAEGQVVQQAAGSLLDIEGLVTGYGSTTVLRGADLSVGRGEVTCLLGRNGVGKTTVLRAAMGLLPTWKGVLRWEGTPISALPTHRRARLGFGFVPQGREILPQLTVEENIRIGGFASGERDPEIPPELFDYFPDLKKMLRRRGGNLSGGQQQQLAIARALMGRPKLLILDEPTEGIQPNLVALIRSVVTALNRERGLSVLLVEQKIGFARKIGHAYTILDRGQVVADGRMESLDDSVIRAHLEVS